MADKIRDIEAKLTEKYNEQVEKGENILLTDPGLLTKMTEFKVLLRDMSLDLRTRKGEFDNKQMETSVAKENSYGNKVPVMSEDELHETKLKQLADLEQGLKVDKQKTIMLLGMILILMFLQAGSFVFM